MDAFAAGGGEDLWEGLHGAGWVGDAVMEHDYGSGGEIFCYKPADVRDGRMQRIVRVRGAEHALVGVGLREAELAGAGDATRWAKEFWSCCYAEDFLGLFEVADEVGIGVEQNRAVGEIVVGNLVSGGFDTRDQIGMAEGALANSEESGLSVVLLENVEDLGREDGVRRHQTG
jgi:hypothetical protein